MVYLSQSIEVDGTRAVLCVSERLAGVDLEVGPACQVCGWISWKAGQRPGERERSPSEGVIVVLEPGCLGGP